MANAMGDRYGINVGNILATSKALQEQDQNTEMRGMQMNAMKQEASDAKAAQGFRESFISAKTPEEKRAAFDHLLTMDAKSALDMVQGTEAMDERGRAEIKRQNNKFGQYAHVVSQAENPEKAFNDVKRYLTPEQQEEWGEYSPMRVNLHLAQAREISDLLEMGEKLMFKDMDFKQQEKILEQQQTFDKEMTFTKLDYDALSQEDKQKHDKEMLKLKSAADQITERIKAGGKGGLKASDVNSMYKQAAALYGGFYDPGTGQFTGLSTDKAQKVQGILTAAERYAAGGAGLAEAVSRAAKESGVDIPQSATVTEETVETVETTEQVSEAPQAALDYLKANPDQKENFKAKYGYLPTGM